MSWPTPQDFSEAVQNPRLNFGDPGLREGTIALSNLGLPVVASGSFASVYRIACGNKVFALRCFLKNIPEQHARYEAISKFVMSDTLPYTVDFHYIARGILIRGQWYPVLKMDWVEGITLDTFVKNNLKSPQKLASLADAFKAMMDELRSAGIAHGDLQHGNILVTKEGELRLVDYDGMFVPALAGMGSGEIGHRNYQHPARDGSVFDAHIDNFSAWSIYTSLVALSRDPSLADALHACDECLLFRQGDYRYPLSSRAFGLLERNNNEQVVHLSKALRTILAKPLTEIPFLRDEIRVAPDLPPVTPEPEAPYALPPVIVPQRRLNPAQQQEADAETEFMSHWPSLKDYINAVSNPARNFLDWSMQSWVLVRDHGAIRAKGTDHGAVFRFRHPDEIGPSGRPTASTKPDMMVKVFLKADQLLEHRYKAFFTFLHGGAPNYGELAPHFADFNFIPEGLRVGQKFYPIVRMKFVKGPTLFEVVEKFREDKTRMRELVHDFVRTMALIESSGIVHGDIEPDNIIVKSDRLVLIDYDLTTVPLSRALASAVRANKHYRHPLLPKGAPIPNDNFAAWIMYYSLKVISLYPQMWNIAGAKPGRLLFHANDLRDPESSHLFKMLTAHYNAEVRGIAEEVMALCKTPPTEVKPVRIGVRATALEVLGAMKPGQLQKQTLRSFGITRRKRNVIVGGLALSSVLFIILTHFPLASLMLFMLTAVLVLSVPTEKKKKP